MLAIVTDAFGGRGGIAQYNRDFLGALAEAGAVSSITVVPRLAPEPPRPAGNDRPKAGAAGADWLFGGISANCALPAGRSGVLRTSLYGAASCTDRATEGRKTHRSDPRG